MKHHLFYSLSIFLLMGASKAQGQTELKLKLNDDGSHFIKATAMNQVWVRYTQNNPSSTVFGDPVSQVTDIGIRRLRFQAFGQLTERVFFYAQFGQNNLTYMQPRFTGAFFHDAIAEYKLYKSNLSIGAGLTGWSGLGRYASPSVGSILTLDAPLYMQATNSVSDQFLRKLSVYAKGKISKLDYRIAMTHPMSIQTGNVAGADKTDSTHAGFSPKYPKMQSQGYLMWQFFDQESNMTPYTAGTYLGKKKVFNIGAGFIYQAQAMRQLREGTTTDTIYKPMALMNVDVFYDAPLNKEKGTALTVYAAASHYDFGKNYVRMIGVMNPTNGTTYGKSLNGTGNAFPMIGTGNIGYLQVGYLMGKKTLPGDGRIQLFAASQMAKFNALKDPMIMYEGGFNYYINGTTGNKISLEYQSRPVYDKDTAGNSVVTSRKGMFVVQYQVSI